MGQSHRRSQFVALAGSRGSITLPVDIRRRYRLDEPGAQVEVIGRPDGVIELHPVLPHSADQGWFWTERWQAMEREVEEDIAAGRVETFNSAEEFVGELDREIAAADEAE
ncbi:MAG: AbrB/MazE/SpoVT family DNA-binding domain-containing protein [Thermoleophilaceae bacterium]